MPRRIAVLSSHPTPYTAPFFRRLHESGALDLTVLYCSAFGTTLDSRPMRNFGRTVVWDIDPFGGYRSKVLASRVRAHPQRRWTMLGLSMLRELTADRYDLVVVFGWAFPAHWLAFALCRRRGIPFLLYGDTNVRDAGSFVPTAIRFPLMSGLCAGAAGALYTGTFNRDFYIRHGMDPDQLWFSPYAVDSPRFASGDRAGTREALGLREGVCYFLFVGTLLPRKRPLSLLAAVADLQKRGRRVGAIFVGTGELELAMRAQIADTGISDVHMLGFVNQTGMPDVYAAADVLVLPSSRDPRGTVVNEAMAASTPVVVSTGTGVWGPGDLVTDGSEGHVYPDGDQDALVDACDALTDPDHRAQMSRAASKRAQEWSFDAGVRGWEAAAARLVAGRPA